MSSTPDLVTLRAVDGPRKDVAYWRVERNPDGSYGPHVGRTFGVAGMLASACTLFAGIAQDGAGFTIDFGGYGGRVSAFLVSSAEAPPTAAQLDAGRANDMLAAATEDVRRLELAIDERKRMLFAALGPRAGRHAAMVFNRRRVAAALELACAEIVAMDAAGQSGDARALLSLQVNAMEAHSNALGFRIAAAEREMRAG